MIDVERALEGFSAPEPDTALLRGEPHRHNDTDDWLRSKVKGVSAVGLLPGDIFRSLGHRSGFPGKWGGTCTEFSTAKKFSKGSRIR